MKLRTLTIGAMVAGLSTFGGCGGDAEEPEASTADSSASSTSPDTEGAAPAWTPPTPEPPPPTYDAGGTAKAEEVEMTVTRIEAVDLGSSGDPGFRETVEAYVQTCTPETASRPWTLDPFAFVAVTGAGREIPVNALLSGVREPAYPTYGKLQPGRCQEGWVQIGMDTGEARTVKSIEWQPNPGETFASWKVKQPLQLGTPDY